MEIIKKHIDTWFGSYVLMTNHDNTILLKVSFNYIANGRYEIYVSLAKRPHNKIFKCWKNLGYSIAEEDKFNSIELMLKTYGQFHYTKYCQQEELNTQRNKKWEEFVKNP